MARMPGRSHPCARPPEGAYGIRACGELPEDIGDSASNNEDSAADIVSCPPFRPRHERSTAAAFLGLPVLPTLHRRHLPAGPCAEDVPPGILGVSRLSPREARGASCATMLAPWAFFAFAALLGPLDAFDTSPLHQEFQSHASP